MDMQVLPGQKATSPFLSAFSFSWDQFLQFSIHYFPDTSEVSTSVALCIFAPITFHLINSWAHFSRISLYNYFDSLPLAFWTFVKTLCLVAVLDSCISSSRSHYEGTSSVKITRTETFYQQVTALIPTPPQSDSILSIFRATSCVIDHLAVSCAFPLHILYMDAPDSSSVFLP